MTNKFLKNVIIFAGAPEWKEGAGALTNDYMKSQIEGTELKLTCPAKGRPKPELIWYKDDEAFFPRTDTVRNKWMMSEQRECIVAVVYAKPIHFPCLYIIRSPAKTHIL